MPVSSSRLAFLSPELLVLTIGLCFGKFNFSSYLLAVPLNVVDIGLKLLLKRLPESVADLCFPLDRLATAHLGIDQTESDKQVRWVAFIACLQQLMIEAWKLHRAV